jgi:hypothetical protein
MSSANDLTATVPPTSNIDFRANEDPDRTGVDIDRLSGEGVMELKAMTMAVNGRCAKLKKMLGEAQAEVVGIGKDLIVIRAYLQENKVPGGFDGWLACDFEWSRSQAYRLIDIAKEFGACPNLGHYDQSAMYLLAAPGTPQEAREEAKHVADSGDFVDYSTAATLIDKYKTDAHEDQTEADAGSPGEITEVADDGNGDLANPSEQGDGEEDDPDEGGDDDTEEDEDEADTGGQPNVPPARRPSGKASGQDIRRTFQATNLESKVWSPEKESYRMEFKRLVTGGGYSQNSIVINQLTSRQLEVLRQQIDDALAGKSDEEIALAQHQPLSLSAE